MTLRRTESRRVVVLGAGASRGVSYALESDSPSPLDSDFFDLLQREYAKPHTSSNKKHINSLLERLKLLPYEYWRSMERSFYTLHLQAYLSKKLSGNELKREDASVVLDFAVCIQTLLRSAHGKKTCAHHREILKRLGDKDALITFNYDLVVERAIRDKFESQHRQFGPWIYALDANQNDVQGPIILKLHGSSNWRWNRNDESLNVQTVAWEDFDDAPGYRGHSGNGTKFPIFLPFWDKRIEHEPWLRLWKKAYNRLSATAELVIWGYSLPTTDIKAQQLFHLSLKGKKRLKLCVIDPSSETRARWRTLLPDALYWEYQDIGTFIKHPPKWWR
ncbi:MAG: hypothetical protein EPN55_07800 [Gammaproteobacteria bacterium]|nr:MAG: hypothetical protein EPN55_07800 [Gammaproteobacteria bacterium]